MTPAADTTTQPQPPTPPPGMYAVQLKKGFTHFGVPYYPGGYFVGDSVEIAALVRQGYCDPPQPPSAAQPGSTDPATTQPSTGY